MPAEADVTEIRQAIKQLISEEIHIAPEKLSEDLKIETVGLNSLMLMKMITTIQDRFGATLDMRALGHVLAPTQHFGAFLDELARHVEARR